jgi:hypothetical protein
MMRFNLVLGTAVTTIGFWLLWGTTAVAIIPVWMTAVGAFLWWQVRTVTEVWAWSTLLLGLESFAWPLLLMIRLQSGSSPTEEEMATVLSAVVLGLFSSVFWISFSYGLFRRSKAATASPTCHTPIGRKKR